MVWSTWSGPHGPHLRRTSGFYKRLLPLKDRITDEIFILQELLLNLLTPLWSQRAQICPTITPPKNICRFNWAKINEGTLRQQHLITVGWRKQIGHAKPAPLQQTNSLFMGFFSGAEKVNFLLSLEECCVWVCRRLRLPSQAPHLREKLVSVENRNSPTKYVNKMSPNSSTVLICGEEIYNWRSVGVKERIIYPRSCRQIVWISGGQKVC